MIQALTVFWGDKHLELWKRGCLKSMALPANKVAFTDLKIAWNIFAETKHHDAIRDAMAEVGLDNIGGTLEPFEKLRDRTDYLLSGTIWQIEKCLEAKSPMLLLPSDTIWGDGSLFSLAELGSDPESVVVVPHPRVLPTILDESFGSNAEMVALSWKHLHRSWSEAMRGHPRQNSFVGGTAWDEIGPGIMAVTHRLPTPYFVNWTAQDLDFFKTRVGYGSFDHEWPGALLMQQGRMRFVGSSDAVFMAEVTEKEKNVPPVVRGADPNKFWKSQPHNVFNRQVTAIWRASRGRFDV